MASRTMQRVNERAGKYLRAANTSVVPQSFLAALTANESLGDPGAKRYERAVLEKLVSVCLGQRPHYHGVTAGMLLLKADLAETHAKFAFRQLAHLQDAATSWGFTQIMGYHAIRMGSSISELANPERHYALTVKLLNECPENCKRKYGVDVDLTKDFEKMARWWNSGNPRGKTYHESYVPNILRRMTQWAQIREA